MLEVTCGMCSSPAGTYATYATYAYVTQSREICSLLSSSNQQDIDVHKSLALEVHSPTIK
jgi:hypothetical protein